MKHSISTRINILVILMLMSLAVRPLSAQQFDSTAVVAASGNSSALSIASPADSSLIPIPEKQPNMSQPVLPKRIKKTPHELTSAYSKKDQLKKRRLIREQARIRAQLDILSNQLLFIDEKVRDSETKIALAKKLKQPKTDPVKPEKPESTRAAEKPRELTSQAIDFAAMNLIREEGLSLDQARLQIIEGLTSKQVASFYATLDKAQRHELYDIIDNAMENEDLDFEVARKSAIFFHFYTQ